MRNPTKISKEYRPHHLSSPLQQVELYQCGNSGRSSLTLAELHVSVLRSFIRLIKLLQNLMKLLLNYIMVWLKFYNNLISDIIVNEYTTKRILKSQYIFKNFIYFIFNWSVYPQYPVQKVDLSQSWKIAWTLLASVVYTWFKFSVTEYWRNIAKYIGLEKTTLEHFNWRVQSDSDGLHCPPPYVGKRKCVSTKDMQRGASSIHSNTRHIQ